MSEAFGDRDGVGGYVPSVWEARLDPEGTAAWAASVTPGSAAAAPLAGLDPEKMTQAGRVDALVALEKLAGWVAARQVRVLAAMADDPMSDAVAPELDREWVKEDVRAALGESAVGAGDRLALAGQLRHRLPDTLAAVEGGRIGMRHARCLAESVLLLDDEAARAVEAVVLAFAESRRDLASFRRKVHREVLRVDPRSAEEQLHDALADRRVWNTPVGDGTAMFGALLPAEGAAALIAALDLRAERCEPDDPRTKDQRRADALVQLALDTLSGGCPHCNGGSKDGDGGSGRLRPAVQVTVALSTLLGLDEQPGELDGYGPINAGLARRIAADESGTWRRLVTDELGRLIDYGRTVYRPPADLTRFVIARDRTCRWPGCNRRACTCEIDHAIPWEEGGQTNEANLGPLCCRHHHGKHDAGWQLRRLPDGGSEWTTPTGHVYVVPAATYPIDTTNAAIKVPDGEHPATEADPDPPATGDPPF